MLNRQFLNCDNYLLEKKCAWNKSWMIMNKVIQTTVELTTMFIGEWKSFSTFTMQRLKGFELNTCVALINEAYQKKKWKKAMWSEESIFIQFQGDKHIRLRRKTDAPIIPSAYCTSLWGQCYDSVGQVQVQCLNILYVQDFPSILFFHSWWHKHILRRQYQDSSVTNCERMVQGAWDIISLHVLATTKSRF